MKVRKYESRENERREKVMKNGNIPTYLRILNNCLSGRSRKIFPNQVVFYNTVFGATNALKLPEESLKVMERVNRGEKREEDESEIRKINYFLRNGLDGNSANVGKHINNTPDMAIPKQHKVHFLEETNRNEIIRRLQITVRFCMTHYQREQQLNETDFQHLLTLMKRDFPGG